MSLALIDADTPAYSAAICSQDAEEWQATSRLDYSIDKIIEASGCSEFKLYVSGGKNFRYEIDPLYKANRPKEHPIHREACKQHLIKQWGAIETDGYEADDAVGCEQTKDTMICGIDKDLLMIPGKHYQWPILRGGKVIKEGKFHNISVEEGYRRFFTQALTGDTSDNIKGIKGIGPKTAEKILDGFVNEEAMYNTISQIYYEADGSFDRFIRNLDLLWIWRAYGETYSIRRLVYG